MPVINNLGIRAEFYSGLQQVTDEMMATATATATASTITGSVSVVETTALPEITNSLTGEASASTSSLLTHLLTDTNSDTIQITTSTSASSPSSSSTVTHVQHEVQTTSSNGAGVILHGNKKKRSLVLGLLGTSLLFSLI